MAIKQLSDLHHVIEEIFNFANYQRASSELYKLHLKKGAFIYSPDNTADKIYFIHKGHVKIGCYGETQKEITKYILTEGQLFGELSLIGMEYRRDFAYATEDTILGVCSVKKMLSLMESNIELTRYFMIHVAQKELALEERLEAMIFKDSRTRIIDYLVSLAEKSGERIGFEIVVRNFITHREIANITATSRQTVTTVLNVLKSNEVITFDRHRMLIRDIKKLKEGGICDV
jgi:CRP/FNR family transcriptional regulator, cyclic AMP receptor protein